MRRLAHWLECYNAGESLDLLRTLALRHAPSAGKVGQQIARLIHRDDIRGLCLFELDPSAEWDSGELYHCRQMLGFFQKLEDVDIGIDRSLAGMSKFYEAETLCGETNRLFQDLESGRVAIPPRIAGRFHEAARHISTVLGRVPDWQQLGYRFGKGATTLTKKRLASLRQKFKAGVACSEELLGSAHAVLAELPHLSKVWSEGYVEKTPSHPKPHYSNLSAQAGLGRATAERLASMLGDLDSLEGAAGFAALVPVVINDGVLSFVRKNAKTFRGIVTEPPLNGLAQTAIGDHMVGRCARFGLDLTDQSLNRELARIGSLTGALATLDLSSASDTMATRLVSSLLPLDWFLLLSRCRTGHVQLSGQHLPAGWTLRICQEKFSSMGNGFTFPLESLIFWALVRACCDDDEVVNVFGDDIICPSHRYEDVVETLRYAGFIVNKAKSYHTGPFRESCGADWYSGVDVRPFFQKKWVSPRSLFLLHNFYVRRNLMEHARFVRDFIHPSLQIFGPDGYGDGHLLSKQVWMQKLDTHLKKGYSGTVFNTFSIKTKWDASPESPSDRVLPLYSTYRRAPEDLIPGGTVDKARRRLREAAKPSEYASFLRIFRKKIEGVGSPLPWVDGVKASTLPGAEDDDSGQATAGLTYHRISIYTLQA